MVTRWLVSFLALALAVGCAACQPITAPELLPAGTPFPIGEEWDGDIPGPGQGCSTVYATDGRQMLGGNNEDSREPLTKVWFVPAKQGTFGLVLFGYGNYRAQGGMNDQGLFFDFLSVPKELPILIEGKQPYTGTNYIVYDAMAQCATVTCVVGMFEKYYDAETWSMQAFFGDATGESAIVEPQAVLRQYGGYQVATNFYQSTFAPEERVNYCPRYKTASEMLAGSPRLSVEYMRDVMAAVHQDGPGSQTVYTNVYDLVNRVVYLYYFYDYEHMVVIDLAEELAKGAHAYDLPALFPPNPAAQEFFASALKDYERATHAQRVEIDPAFLAAYVGEYAPPESAPPESAPPERAPRAPGDWVSVVPNGTSLMMIFPDSHRYELFPRSEMSFFVIAWDKQYERFIVPFNVNFGVDEVNGRVLYMDFVFGSGGDYVRNERLGIESYVPYIPVKSPASQPAVTSLAPTSHPPASAPGTGFPWGWILLPLALLAAVFGWVIIRRKAAHPALDPGR